MRRLTLLASIAGLAIPLLSAVSANAQATRTWVSGVGDDVNPCSRTAPCKTFAGAISKTAAGGEINCIDPGGFGTVTITKSLTIDCIGTDGSILASSTNGVTINDSATATPGTIIVSLRNLTINGATTGLIGVNFISGAALNIENSWVSGFKAGTAIGIRVANSAGNPKIAVSDTIVTNNGTGVTGAGIQVRPTGTATAVVQLTRVQANGNVFGVVADGAGGTGAMSIHMHKSGANNNSQTGILAASDGNAINIMVHDSSSSFNGTGIAASGTGATVRVGSSSIAGNGIALSGASTLSYGNNQVDGNAGGEAFGGAVPGGLK